ncbi:MULTISPECIES: phage head completion protein [unclassified Shinella]|uniref:phage head completion protein n=1 Tax=unclassified Shinella TaxID=2643062 RepID=UPI00234FB1AF|nr:MULTISPECIES: hypothetical protein [unclassified Shinella]MCO5152581.1 hypothetical protein [Shinella sp.]MDC7261876.1 hypothetical protein [Shinella sp. HY16]MDC7268771.1 hypothetical protein [Shinella sp. YZ44]
MLAVARAIDRRAVNVTLTTRPDGTYNDDGDVVDAAPEVNTIRAAIQPASGRQLMDLPEGIRTEARWLLWSRSEVEVDNLITAKGLSYRVMHVWPRDEGAFFRAALGQLKA